MHPYNQTVGSANPPRLEEHQVPKTILTNFEQIPSEGTWRNSKTYPSETSNTNFEQMAKPNQGPSLKTVN